MADASVREATAADAAAIAEVQVQAWRAGYADVLPASALAVLEPAAVEARWRDALEHRHDTRGRVLVAVADGRVVGLTAIAPATDDDLDASRSGELGPLLVLPERQHAGHGSRLLAAATDLARYSGFAHLVAWVPSVDTALQDFLTTAGWASDGATRTLETGGAAVAEQRFETALAG